jgi:hypothetical protein
LCNPFPENILKFQTSFHLLLWASSFLEALRASSGVVSMWPCKKNSHIQV